MKFFNYLLSIIIYDINFTFLKLNEFYLYLCYNKLFVKLINFKDVLFINIKYYFILLFNSLFVLFYLS